MNKVLFIIKQYVTKILIVPILAYAFLSFSCPTCEHRIEQNSPAFFLEIKEQSNCQHQTNITLDTEELKTMGNSHA